ncbi:MAG: Cu+-exporting ATPase [Crocinitomicaceae bacterium]|jgi:Cu+-exporting ATPase
MSESICYHCGDNVIDKSIVLEDKVFCCAGCKSVYQLLAANDLDSFYEIDRQAGQRPKEINEHKYNFLEVEEIRNKFIDFEDESTVHITLFLPQIHCSSCIYLLENIQKLEPAVISCQVDFTQRQANFILSKTITIANFALLLDKIGYAPNFGDRKKIDKKRNNQFMYKLGVAGFAFGSIMLWSFPEYLGIEETNPEFRSFTSYLSLAVSIPVILYSANEYLISAFKAIRYKSLNLDVPISIGILALYIQSCYTIFAGLGPGYMDSFAGFVFFLLIGKWFQNKTYDSLSFDRDYTSYFPVAVTRILNEEEAIVEIDQVKIDDRIVIRNEEVLPCDSTLISEEARIDYSFVTGESVPIKMKKGDLIYAGGKLIGQKSEFLVQKESNRSHLTKMWNESSRKEPVKSKSDKLSIYFLVGVLVISLISAIAWITIDSSRVTEIVVSVLIVACPCALALSRPFTYGNIMRILGRKGLYLKNTDCIDGINSVDDIVFDKTGTLTHGNSNEVRYQGEILTGEEMAGIVLLANSSTHPLSRGLVNHLNQNLADYNLKLTAFSELKGQGIEGNINGRIFKIGSAQFVGDKENSDRETSVFISIDSRIEGRFVFKSSFRDGIADLIENLSKGKTVHVLSGDNDKDLNFFESHTPSLKNIHFNQIPSDKFEYIKAIQSEGRKVMMIGDGLNDSGALNSADIGIAISEDIFRFSPSSDAIIEASKLAQLNQLLRISKFSKVVLASCFIFSIIYNLIGLSFAVTGHLTPLIAAILMPLSSISIVLLSTILSSVKK